MTSRLLAAVLAVFMLSCFFWGGSAATTALTVLRCETTAHGAPATPWAAIETSVDHGPAGVRALVTREGWACHLELLTFITDNAPSTSLVAPSVTGSPAPPLPACIAPTHGALAPLAAAYSPSTAACQAPASCPNPSAGQVLPMWTMIWTVGIDGIHRSAFITTSAMTEAQVVDEVIRVSNSWAAAAAANVADQAGEEDSEEGHGDGDGPTLIVQHPAAEAPRAFGVVKDANVTAAANATLGGMCPIRPLPAAAEAQHVAAPAAAAAKPTTNATLGSMCPIHPLLASPKQEHVAAPAAAAAKPTGNATLGMCPLRPRLASPHQECIAGPAPTTDNATATANNATWDMCPLASPHQAAPQAQHIAGPAAPGANFTTFNNATLLFASGMVGRMCMAVGMDCVRLSASSQMHVIVAKADPASLDSMVAAEGHGVPAAGDELVQAFDSSDANVSAGTGAPTVGEHGVGFNVSLVAERGLPWWVAKSLLGAASAPRPSVSAAGPRFSVLPALWKRSSMGLAS